jgi:hypothetical protein
MSHLFVTQKHGLLEMQSHYTLGDLVMMTKCSLALCCFLAHGGQRRMLFMLA